ncbi:MAG TPA: hypothetical protein VGC54_06190 [Planctomycetota bacterium]
MLSLGQVIQGEVGELLRRRLQQEKSLRKFIQSEGLDAFPAVVVDDDWRQGISALVQCHGLGALRPNLVLTGWSSDAERQEEFFTLLRTLEGLERSIAILRLDPTSDRDPWNPPPGPIDVWWRGKENGHLMLLLGHLLQLNEGWRGKRLRLLRVIASEAGREDSLAHLRQLLIDARIEADARIVVDSDPREAIRKASVRSAITFLGFRVPDAGDEDELVVAMGTMMQGMGTVMQIHSAGRVELEA